MQAAEAGLSLVDRIAQLKAQGIHSVLAQFTDLHGVPKGKLVPVVRLAEWVESGAGFAGPSIWGTGLPRMGARSEYMGRVVPESLQPLPFMPGVAHAVCDGFAGGQALDTCSRQVLKAQLSQLAARGWTLWVGVEPEFFLFSASGGQAGQPAGDPLDQLSKPSYDLKSIHRQQALLEDLRSCLTQLGFDILQIDHEDANDQYELNYRFTDALTAADRYQLFKLSAHAIAQRHGQVFSAMPKPRADSPGSGLHFHLSITDAAGRAVMAQPSGVGGLSSVGNQFVAGLLGHADALAALCAPTVNSYKRLAVSDSRSGTTWSPVWKAMGTNNRTCLVRTVDGRIEWRLPDPSCNIYLAIAATLAAGLDGIDRGLPPVVAHEEDLYSAFAAGLPTPDMLPRDLHDALVALQDDELLRQATGRSVCEQFLAMKWPEWRAYAQHVSTWEHEQYFSLY